MFLNHSQCLDGKQECYNALTFDLKNGALNDTELERLQDEVFRIFYVQYNHRNMEKENLQDISNHKLYDEIRKDSDINGEYFK